MKMYLIYVILKAVL